MLFHPCVESSVIVIGFFSPNLIIKNLENDEKIQKKLFESFFRGHMRPMTMIIGIQITLKL